LDDKKLLSKDKLNHVVYTNSLYNNIQIRFETLNCFAFLYNKKSGEETEDVAM
jgi:hypothetical protein